MMWEGIRNIIRLKANNGSIITEINSSEGSRINDPIQIANSFNRYFSNVATEITKKIPLTQKSPIDPLPNSFFLSSAIPTEVSAIISALKDNKASGPNSIPIKLLKILNSHISVSLSILINQSFESGIFPDKLKIIPIFKEDDSSLVSNYRPISLLSIFSEVFEKAMYERL